MRKILITIALGLVCLFGAATAQAAVNNNPQSGYWNNPGHYNQLFWSRHSWNSGWNNWYAAPRPGQRFFWKNYWKNFNDHKPPVNPPNNIHNPEPLSALLFLLGGTGLVCLRRKQQ